MATSRAHRESMRARRVRVRGPNRSEFEKKFDEMGSRHARIRRAAVIRNK